MFFSANGWLAGNPLMTGNVAQVGCNQVLNERFNVPPGSAGCGRHSHQLLPAAADRNTAHLVTLLRAPEQPD